MCRPPLSYFDIHHLYLHHLCNCTYHSISQMAIRWASWTFCDICSRAGDLFRHHHEEPGCLLYIQSLSYVTVFSRPCVRTRGSPSDFNLCARATERSKLNTSSRSSENTHPLSQITIWEENDGLPNFETFDEKPFQLTQLFIGATKVQSETPEL